jgi:hypothetical protein
MARGYREAKYHYSTARGLAAARAVLNAQKGLDRAPLIKEG